MTFIITIRQYNTQHEDTQHNNWLTLSVTIESVMLGATTLSVIMLNVVGLVIQLYRHQCYL